ncbi:MAG: hypothetical protein ACHQ49_09320 [Elusimicrobiota bacterium]
MPIELLALSALLLLSPGASAGDSGIRLGPATVDPAAVTAGDSVGVSVDLRNDSDAVWAEGRYSVQVELLSPNGRLVSRTTPLAVDAAIAPGESKSLRIKGIRVPADLSGSCSVRVLVLDRAKAAAKGKRTSFVVAPSPHASLEELTVEPVAARPGDSVKVRFTLRNASSAGWEKNRRQIAIEMLDSSGTVVFRSSVKNVAEPIAAGQSRSLTFKGIVVPAGVSGDCSVRASLLKNGAVLEASPGRALSISAAEPEPHRRQVDGRASPSPEAEEDGRDGSALHEGAANLDLNYPGAALRYFWSGQSALETRTQFQKNEFSIGSRVYWYPAFLAAGKFFPYLCPEIDFVAFKTASLSGSGLAAGGFAGIEYALSRSFALQTDVGGEYFSVKEKGASITQNDLEFILNFGVNYYFK